MNLETISRKLCKQVSSLKFAPPVETVYNPLEYAWESHREYLRRYGTGKKQAIFLGMNPGPFGMAQTGIPFGDVAMVRDFLGIQTAVKKPDLEHPARPIDGFSCARSEVSGTRFWSWAKDRFGTADRFFEKFFVVNWCPLAFMEKSGTNRTPDKLPARERDELFSVCDQALREMVEELQPEWVIGVGAFARDRAEIALAEAASRGKPVQVGMILHPSPASPAANRGWAAAAEKSLKALRILGLVGTLFALPAAASGPILHGDRNVPEVALTFDACSGSDPHLDTGVVRVLESAEVAATFFLGGRWMEANPEALVRLRANPRFELAIHAYRHPHLDRLTGPQLHQELLAARQVFAEKLGFLPRFLRAPFGDWDANVVREAERLGLEMVQWDLPSGDPDPAFTGEKIRRHVAASVKRGSILVFHVNGRGWHSAEAMPSVLEELRKRGLKTVTLSELVAHSGEHVVRAAVHAPDLK